MLAALGQRAVSAAASERRLMPSLASRFDTKFLTVFSAWKSCSPIWRLVIPSAMRSRMRSSWSVRPVSSDRLWWLAQPVQDSGGQ